MGGGIVNRDVNASRNILLLAECLINGHPRPAAFTRTTRLYIRASSIFSNDGGEPEKTNTRLTRIFGFYFISIF